MKVNMRENKSDTISNAERISDEALTTDLKTQRAVADQQAKPILAGIGVVIVGSVMFALGVAIPTAPALVWVAGAVILLAGVAILIVGMLKHRNSFREARHAVEIEMQHSIREMLQRVFENVEYDKHQTISKETIKESNMIPMAWNNMSGSDYIRGVYHGLRIEMSDILLREITYTKDSDGRRQTHSKTAFEGLWLICDFGKHLSADVKLIEKHGRSDFAKKSLDLSNGIDTENAAFNEKFVVLSDNPHDVFYILTPHMMEHILRADAMGAGDTSMYFSRDGKVHIAINSGRNAFEVDWKALELTGTKTLEDIRQHFESELRYALDIIDELRLNTNS